ncbi:hypothetical protein Cgig2_007486 [Carnegiea gigantea]|uniref:Uncharacterized protein n=1 Tax=Carnegiea gigantea TaxID=171969 RepID=A0A9Q1K633_9CARY|nr:hypothetical protein Cgig2_007486 [Carnegiea gigantea]
MSPLEFAAMIEKFREVQRHAIIVTLYISPDKKIEITPIDVHLTLALPIGGRKVEEFYEKKPKDAKYNEVLIAWRKEWNLQDGTPKLSQMPQYILSQTEGSTKIRVARVVLAKLRRKRPNCGCQEEEEDDMKAIGSGEQGSEKIGWRCGVVTSE